MKSFYQAMIIGLVCVALLTLSLIHYRLTQAQVSYNHDKYTTHMRLQNDRKKFADQMGTLREYSKRLIALSHESETNVDYDILLSDHDLEKLQSKIISTYSDGLFFLTHALIESGPSEIRLAVEGFRVGEEGP